MSDVITVLLNGIFSCLFVFVLAKAKCGTEFYGLRHRHFFGLNRGGVVNGRSKPVVFLCHRNGGVFCFGYGGYAVAKKDAVFEESFARVSHRDN